MNATDYRISTSSIIEVFRDSQPKLGPNYLYLLLQILDKEMPVENQMETLTDLLSERNQNGELPNDILIGEYERPRDAVNKIAQLLLMSDRDFALVATAE